MPHVLLAIEWLAKLHGLTYVAKKRYEKNHTNEDWQSKNPWIKKEWEDSSNYTMVLIIYFFDGRSPSRCKQSFFI